MSNIPSSRVVLKSWLTGFPPDYDYRGTDILWSELMDRVLVGTVPGPTMTAAPSIEHIAVEFGPMLRRVARAHEADAGLAEELCQETLLAIWRSLPAYRGDAPLRAFIARIAMNHAVDHVRRALRRAHPTELSLELPDPGDGPEQQVVTHDQRASLLLAVQQLPLPYRQATLLTLEGLSGGEVARVLGISANAVALRLSRAKSILRKKLEGAR
jgi:RNA polymerase sigma factor (sigma-70 family)